MVKTKFYVVLVVLSLVIMLSGCATVQFGTTEWYDKESYKLMNELKFGDLSEENYFMGMDELGNIMEKNGYERKLIIKDKGDSVVRHYKWIKL